MVVWGCVYTGGGGGSDVEEGTKVVRAAWSPWRGDGSDVQDDLGTKVVRAAWSPRRGDGSEDLGPAMWMQGGHRASSGGALGGHRASGVGIEDDLSMAAA